MHPTKKKWSVIFLLVIAPIIEASTHCEQKWDDIKAPHNVADNYHIYLLKINTTEEYRSFMPNTKYQGNDLNVINTYFVKNIDTLLYINIVIYNFMFLRG